MDVCAEHKTVVTQMEVIDKQIGPGGDANLLPGKQTLDDRATSPLPSNNGGVDTDNGSPNRPTDDAAEPMEMAHSDLESSVSRDLDSPLTVTSDSTVTSMTSDRTMTSVTTATSDATSLPRGSGEIITSAVLAEEEKLERETKEKEQEEMRKRKELWEHMNADSKAERYRKLQYLLTKSNMYTAYLIQRMDQQKEEQRIRRERAAKRQAKQPTESEDLIPTTAETSKDNDTRIPVLDAERPVLNKDTPASDEKVSPGESKPDVAAEQVDVNIESPQVVLSQSSQISSPSSQSSQRSTRSKLRAPVPKSRLASATNSPAIPSTPAHSPHFSAKMLVLTESPIETLKPESPTKSESATKSKFDLPVKPEDVKHTSGNSSLETDKGNKSSCSPQSDKEKKPPSLPESEKENKPLCSPQSEKENTPQTSQQEDVENKPQASRRSLRTRNSLAPAEAEGVKKGRKRKTTESPKSTGHISNFFKLQPTSKKQKTDAEDSENTADVDKISDAVGGDSSRTEGSKPASAELETSATGEENESDKDKPKIKIAENLEKISEQREDPQPVIDEDGTVTKPALFTGGELRPYQVEGLNWLKVLFENGINGILADEMGLGKTIQCIALVAHLGALGIRGPFLVVAPLSTLPNWKSEFERFAPKIPILFYHGSRQTRLALRKKIRKSHKIMKDTFVQPVVITSYEIAMRDRVYLQNYEWHYMIVDEGHRLKNQHCRLIKELRLYKNTHRLLLTGTPLQNNLSELWSLLHFLLPEIFDDLGSFEMWFDVAQMQEEGSEEAIVQQEQKDNILSMLHQILVPFMLRRVKTDVDLNIPPKKELLVYAPLTVIQKDFYETTIDRTILKKMDEKNNQKKEPEKLELSDAGRPKRRSTQRKVDYSLMMETAADVDVPTDKVQDEEDLEAWVEAVVDYSKPQEKEQKVRTAQVTVKLQNIVMQLRKICNHPYLLEYPLDPRTGDYRIDEDLVRKCGKMQLLDKMLVELKKRGHKVLLFSQMTKMLDILEDYCYLRRFQYTRLDGSCGVDDRQQSMDRFNRDPEVFLFLLSTRAGGLGINLIAADTVIIYDSDWNPQCDLQAQDRCHRIGQTRPVVVYRLVTANTVDQRIVERAATKRKLEKMIIRKGRFKAGIRNFQTDLKPLSPLELIQLLNSEDHDATIESREGQVISRRELDELMDRSDMCKDYAEAQKRHNKKQKKPSLDSSPDVDGAKEHRLFKVIDIDQGGTTLASVREAQDGSQKSETSESSQDSQRDVTPSECSQNDSVVSDVVVSKKGSESVEIMDVH